MSPRRVLAYRIVGFVVVGVLVGLFAHRIDWTELALALRRAELWPLAFATAAYFAALFGKAVMWRILLAPHNVVGIGRLYRYTIAAFAASVLAPARAGELLRVLALRQRDGVSAADATAVAVTDKLLHAVTLLVLAAPLPIVLPALADWVADTLLVGASLAVGALLAIYVAVGRVELRERQSWFARFLAGMHAVREPRRILAVLGVSVLVWGCELVSVVAALRAVDVELSLAGCLFILFALNVAIAVPATPANVGTLQLGALVATGLLGVPHEPALAFALLYHAIQIVPLLVVGIPLEFRLVIPASTRGKLAA